MKAAGCSFLVTQGASKKALSHDQNPATLSKRWQGDSTLGYKAGNNLKETRTTKTSVVDTQISSYTQGKITHVLREEDTVLPVIPLTQLS